MNLKYQKSISGLDIISETVCLKVAADGYIRLTFDEFRRIELVHLISGLDEDERPLLREAAVATDITGYTEWVSATEPVISIGWDWMIRISRDRRSFYDRIAEPRGNVMLVDIHGQDFGPGKSATLIETVIDDMPWQDVVQTFINSRYAC